MQYYCHLIIIYIIFFKSHLIFTAPLETPSCPELQNVILIFTNNIKNISLFKPEPNFIKSVQGCPDEYVNCNCPVLLKSGLQSFLEWTKQVMQMPSALISSDSIFSFANEDASSQMHRRSKRDLNSNSSLLVNDEMEEEIFNLIQMVENVRRKFLKSFIDSVGYLSEVDKSLNIHNNSSKMNVNGNLVDIMEPILENLIAQTKSHDQGWTFVILNNELGNMTNNSSAKEVPDAYANLVPELSNGTLLILAELCNSTGRGPYNVYALGKCHELLGPKITSLAQIPEMIRLMFKENLSLRQPVDLFQVEDDLFLADWSPPHFFQQHDWMPRAPLN